MDQCRMWHPEPSPGRADLRVPGRAGDVEHAELGEGGRRSRRRRQRDAAQAAEAAVLEAAALARPATDPHGGAARLTRRRRRHIMLLRRDQSLIFLERRVGMPWPSWHVALAEAYPRLRGAAGLGGSLCIKRLPVVQLGTRRSCKMGPVPPDEHEVAYQPELLMYLGLSSCHGMSKGTRSSSW